MKGQGRAEIPIEQKRMIRVLLLTMAVLIVCHLFSELLGRWSWQVERLFHLDRESNIPTWFSSLLWALGAWAAYGCAQAPRASRRERRVWMVASLGLLFLSCDEVALFHENFGRIAKRWLFAPGALAQFQVTSWPITLGPFIAIGLAWLSVRLRECLRGSPETAKLLWLGITVFLLGAVGFELTLNFLQNDSWQWLRKTEVVLEESLEMVGSITVFSGLLLHLETLQARSVDH